MKICSLHLNLNLRISRYSPYDFMHIEKGAFVEISRRFNYSIYYLSKKLWYILIKATLTFL